MSRFECFLKNNFIFLFVIALSFFFSFVTLYHYPIFNPDGELYLKAADAFLKSGIHASMKIYPWPLYSVLIGILSKITALSLLNSAYLINFIFSALIAVVFLLIVQALGANKRILWLAVLVFFVFHAFNSYRADIIRGHGYWFFFLLSFLFLTKFSQSKSWTTAILWSISIILATLFRIEGGVYFVLVPFVVLFFDYRWKEKCFAYLKLNVLLIIALCLILFVGYSHLISHLGRIHELLFQFHQGVLVTWQLLVKHNSLLKQDVLGTLGQDDSSVFLFFGMLGTYLYNVIISLSFACFLILIYGTVKKQIKFPTNIRWIFLSYILISIVITVAFYIQYFFVSQRYIFPLLLVLLLWVPFGLNILYQDFKCRKSWCSVEGILFYFVCLLMTAMLVSSIFPFGHSKRYIYQAGIWIKNNTEKSAVVCTNYSRLHYIINRDVISVDEYQVFQDRLVKCHYLVLNFSKKQMPLESKIGIILGNPPLKVFPFKNENEVVIFRIDKK